MIDITFTAASNGRPRGGTGTSLQWFYFEGLGMVMYISDKGKISHA